MQHGGKAGGNKRGQHYEAVLEGGTPQSVWQTVRGSERSNGIIKRWYEQAEEREGEREVVGIGRGGEKGESALEPT